MERIKELKFQKLSAEEMNQVQGGKTVVLSTSWKTTNCVECCPNDPSICLQVEQVSHNVTMEVNIFGKPKNGGATTTVPDNQTRTIGTGNSC